MTWVDLLMNWDGKFKIDYGQIHLDYRHKIILAKSHDLCDILFFIIF